MFIRLPAILTAAILVVGITHAALAQAPARPAAQQRNLNTPTLSEVHQDWTLRCFNVRGPAPCEILQESANQQRQRVLSVSFAFIPQRNAFAMQIVAPLGVAIGKGLTLNAGERPLRNMRFSRCSRQGCFVELIVDQASVDAIARAAQGTVVVIPYGQTNEVKLPMSLKGFAASLARLKTVAREKYTPSAAAPGAAAPARPAAPAPAPAPPPAAPTPAP
jgi:invasion protein IalB